MRNEKCPRSSTRISYETFNLLYIEVHKWHSIKCLTRSETLIMKGMLQESKGDVVIIIRKYDHKQ